MKITLYKKDFVLCVTNDFDRFFSIYFKSVIENSSTIICNNKCLNYLTA